MLLYLNACLSVLHAISNLIILFNFLLNRSEHQLREGRLDERARLDNQVEAVGVWRSFESSVSYSNSESESSARGSDRSADRVFHRQQISDVRKKGGAHAAVIRRRQGKAKKRCDEVCKTRSRKQKKPKTS